jgi:DNA polymerase III delta prime subunit
MTIEAQNALLKTLEEPRNNRYIILITHSVNDLLRTIQSRCFTLHFGSVNKNELCKVYGESEYINDVNGCPGFLHKIYHDDEFRKIIECARSELQILAKRNLHERLKLALELSKKDDVYLQAFFQVWIYRIWTAAHKTKKFQLIKVADKIEKTLNKMNSTNVNKQLVLEDLLIKIV